jgi:diguanylate cyclase (GGDEF)-like protein
MPILARLTLRQMLTLPYVILVLALALIIGFLSFGAGRDAINNLSGQLLTETVNRIAQAVEKHVAGSAAVLETAFPRGVPSPSSIEAEQEALRTRFWLATSVHRDPNNYAYYGDRKGHFFGLWRFSDSEAELRLRTSGEGPRTIYRFTDINGPLKDPVQELRVFDPRERPWYKAGQESPLHTWTSIYIDFKTEALVATRARRVNNSLGEFDGVVATDLSLAMINQFLRGLDLSRNGLALVVEDDGNIIGTSRGPHLKVTPDGTNLRLNAVDSNDPFIATTYRQVQSLLEATGGADRYTGYFEQQDGSLVQVAYAQIQDQAGLNWTIIVAVPRNDFLHRIIVNFKQTAAVAVLASLVVVLIGLSVLNAVSRELRSLASAARSVGDGNLAIPVSTYRNDEIGDLAKSFATMQQKLLTDRLTGLSNREAFLRHIEDRIVQKRRASDPRPFAVLFLDFNGFKAINDRFGHDTGDKVLQELSQRLQAHVRGGDSVARYAGDEFLVLLDSVESRTAAELARNHLATLLAEPLQCLSNAREDDIRMTAAIGIAMFPDSGLDVESLLKRADADMYQHKRTAEKTG